MTPDNDFVILCVTDNSAGTRDVCPQKVHDWPLPNGYVAAQDEATRRLRKGWRNLKCKHCGRFGWAPGKLTPADTRVPAPKVSR